MRNEEEIMLFIESVAKKQGELADAIEKEDDFDTNHKKKCLSRFLRSQIEEFEHLRDGTFVEESEDILEDGLDTSLSDEDIFGKPKQGGDSPDIDLPPLEDDSNIEDMPPEDGPSSEDNAPPENENDTEFPE